MRHSVTADTKIAPGASKFGPSTKMAPTGTKMAPG